MTKFVSRFLSVVLALMLAFSAIACLAETETENLIDDYEQVDSSYHRVYYTTFEYPIDEDGERGSGKPVGEFSELEEHDFEDDECVVCGYVTSSKDDEDNNEDAAPSDNEDVTEETVEEVVTFTVASGIEIEKGTAAVTVLKQVFASLASTKVTLVDVTDEVAAALLDALNNNATTAELLAILAEFPVQIVDGVECYIVTMLYTDAKGAQVTESYAFSTEDATLVKVF